MSKIIRFIKRTRMGFRNIKYYWKVIWNDRDSDYEYILILMHKKIIRMEKFFTYEENVTSDDHLEVAVEMREIRLALERVLGFNNYDYEDEAIKMIVDKDDVRKPYVIKEELIRKDLEMIFSKDLSKDIRGWWD